MYVNLCHTNNFTSLYFWSLQLWCDWSLMAWRMTSRWPVTVMSMPCQVFEIQTSNIKPEKKPKNTPNGRAALWLNHRPSWFLLYKAYTGHTDPNSREGSKYSHAPTLLWKQNSLLFLLDMSNNHRSSSYAIAPVSVGPLMWRLGRLGVGRSQCHGLCLSRSWLGP